jgi:DNA mismatch repair ATPase MutS
MRLDSAAVDALNLVPIKSQTSGVYHKSSSLYGLLNLCRTNMGSRRLMVWIRQPLMDLQKIGKSVGRWSVVGTNRILVERQDIIELFVKEHDLRKPLWVSRPIVSIRGRPGFC